MTIHDVSLGHAATADYSLLVAEAALVLSQMASGPFEDRADELATLRDIYAEGADFADAPGIPSSLHRVFASILALAERIAESRELPEATLAQVHVTQSMARAISAALDDDPGQAAYHLDTVNRCVAVLASDTEVASDLTAATEAASSALARFVAAWSC